ncbi:hypothetical protein [Marinicrinis sediminis]|uniref:Zinc-finger domain-containing protein n=1 Tax=Marinicrinis sediminis TaxID=1652465 RepID=A0ABW5RC00_9BACL
MHCEEIVDKVTSGAALGADERAHLQQCAACTELVEALQESQDIWQAESSMDGTKDAVNVMSPVMRSIMEQEKDVPSFAHHVPKRGARIGFLLLALLLSIGMVELQVFHQLEEMTAWSDRWSGYVEDWFEQLGDWF